MKTNQRVLFTIAGIIFIGLLFFSLASGEFAEVSVLRKSLKVLFAVVGAYWLWKAWGSAPRSADPRR
jgi:hypothetical protein